MIEDVVSDEEARRGYALFRSLVAMSVVCPAMTLEHAIHRVTTDPLVIVREDREREMRAARNTLPEIVPLPDADGGDD